MKDNGLRRAVKRACLWRYKIDVGVTRWILRLRGEGPQYDLVGACTGCGQCCVSPMIQVHTVLFFARSTRWVLLAWHRWINGFEYVGENRRERAFIFRCTHYDPSTRECDSYDSRPGVCRDYPRNLAYDPNPSFLPECSYRAISKNAVAIRASLEELEDLTPHERTELARRLRADEQPPD